MSTFHMAEPSDWPAVASLLTAAHLPLDGARDHLPGFLLAFEGDTLVGIAGTERYGDSALLRRPAILVRPATDADLPDITRIYNQGIEDRSTLETELRTVDERRTWLGGHTGRHPAIVAVRQGEVLGWASLNPFNARQAYRFVADISVYVERAERGTGIGSALMADLIARAGALGYHKLVLTTFPQMVAAVGLYEKFGFRTVGDYREQGLLDGQWTDTRIMERLL